LQPAARLVDSRLLAHLIKYLLVQTDARAAVIAAEFTQSITVNKTLQSFD
jgi:hypothetical protein